MVKDRYWRRKRCIPPSTEKPPDPVQAPGPGGQTRVRHPPSLSPPRQPRRHSARVGALPGAPEGRPRPSRHASRPQTAPLRRPSHPPASGSRRPASPPASPTARPASPLRARASGSIPARPHRALTARCPAPSWGPCAQALGRGRRAVKEALVRPPLPGHVRGLLRWAAHPGSAAPWRGPAGGAVAESPRVCVSQAAAAGAGRGGQGVLGWAVCSPRRSASAEALQPLPLPTGRQDCTGVPRAPPPTLLLWFPGPGGQVHWQLAHPGGRR